MIIDLDTPAGLDPVRVGGKASALAAARKAGAAVLPGVIVEGAASRDHMELGAKTLPGRGSGGARLVVSGEPVDFADELVEAGEGLGERLVARSSTLLETSGEWSGAFTSYIDITPSDLPKAVVGCWASAFSVAALERQEAAGVEPGSFPMSVLVQPALDPVAGGWAEMADDGTIRVHGIKGAPAPLLQGWETGHVARYQGTWEGDELLELVGETQLEEIRHLLEKVDHEMGANRCEWALTDRIWALQVARAVTEVSATPVTFETDVPDELIDVVRVVTLAPGALGEEMVLPWAMAGLPDVDLGGEGATIEEARGLSRQLTEQVWGAPLAQAEPAAARMLNALRGDDPGSVIPMIRRLRRPDPRKASRLLAALRAFRVEMAERGVAVDEDSAWYLDLDSMDRAREGKGVTVPHRLGIGRWEPLVASVVLSASTPARGTPASPGVGGGRRVDVVDAHRQRPRRRGVVVAGQPIPNLASHLWDGAGVVTGSGSPAAHLFEAARALRVPAVCGVDLGEPCDQIVAIDGHSGLVGTLALDREL